MQRPDATQYGQGCLYHPENKDRIDRCAGVLKNTAMTPVLDTSPTAAQMQAAAERAAKGLRDPDAMRRAAQDMDRISDEVRRRQGLLDLAVRYIRELRG